MEAVNLKCSLLVLMLSRYSTDEILNANWSVFVFQRTPSTFVVG